MICQFDLKFKIDANIKFQHCMQDFDGECAQLYGFGSEM